MYRSRPFPPHQSEAGEEADSVVSCRLFGAVLFTVGWRFRCRQLTGKKNWARLKLGLRLKPAAMAPFLATLTKEEGISPMQTIELGKIDISTLYYVEVFRPLAHFHLRDERNRLIPLKPRLRAESLLQRENCATYRRQKQEHRPGLGHYCV